jgi:NAD(P)-dependent dehydrogenase (short-subunit alcohol dehydrogenase family)
MDASFSLAGKVAVVTGGLGLLGDQFCQALRDAGATVVIADLDGAACRRRAEALGAGAFGREVDITDPASLAALRDAVLARDGRLDILVHAAAANDRFDETEAGAPFESYSLAAWRRLLDVNLTGTFLTCQILGAEMARQGSGSIITLGSTYALVAPDQRIYRRADGSQRFWKSPVYPAAKGGVVAFTRFLAAHWASRGVRANVLCPGGVAQGQEPYFVAHYAARTPLGRMAEPEDLRGAVLFLASEASRYMTGATLVVDGGWTAW